MLEKQELRNRASPSRNVFSEEFSAIYSLILYKNINILLQNIKFSE